MRHPGRVRANTIAGLVRAEVSDLGMELAGQSSTSREADELLPRSVVLVAPTSIRARPASFRPEIELLGETTRVLVEQVGAIDAGRLGDLVGRVTRDQRWPGVGAGIAPPAEHPSGA